MTPAEINVHVLAAVAVAVLAARLLGAAFARLRQPRVQGEILAGILLGPSLLGLVWPAAESALFPPEVVAALKPLAQIGLVLFMFLIGRELDSRHLSGSGHRAVAISHASILVPMGFGAALALWLQPRLMPGTDNRVGFALFMGVAMAITAFPVLARVLQETGLSSTRLGALAITCAAVDDVTAWCILAVVVTVVESTSWRGAAITVVAAIAFTLVMLVVVRRLLARAGRVPLAVALSFALLCAWLTEQIGIHAIFGAFLAGMVMPDAERSEDLSPGVRTIVTELLLPVFFVVVGLATRIDLLDSAYLWGVTALVVAVAVAGKLGGSSLAARTVGEGWRDSLTIGVLMNTRGLTEIVILTVGLELRVINDTLFTIMVVMALVTTLMAPPFLRILQPDVVGAHRRGRRGGSGDGPGAGDELPEPAEITAILDATGDEATGARPGPTLSER